MHTQIGPLTQVELEALLKTPNSEVFKKHIAEIQYFDDREKADREASQLQYLTTLQRVEKEDELSRQKEEQIEFARQQKAYNENLANYYHTSPKTSFLESSIERVNSMACLAVLKELGEIFKEFQQHYETMTHAQKDLVQAQAKLDDIDTQWKNTLADLIADCVTPTSSTTPPSVDTALPVITSGTAEVLSTPALSTPVPPASLLGTPPSHSAPRGRVLPAGIASSISSMGLPSDPATMSRYAPHIAGEYKNRTVELATQYGGDDLRARTQARDEFQLSDLYLEHLASQCFARVTPQRVQYLRNTIRSFDDLYLAHQVSYELAQERYEAARAAASASLQRAHEVTRQNEWVLGSASGNIHEHIANNNRMLKGRSELGYQPAARTVTFSPSQFYP